MSPAVISLIILIVLVAIMAALYFTGNKMQKKQMAQKEQIAAAAQQVTMLVIDKKVMRFQDANMPKAVVEQTPKRMMKAKLPIVKAKIGPQMINLICDEDIFASLPTKGEVKAMVSGIYITEIKSVRSKKKAQVEEAPVKKGIGAKLRAKQKSLQAELEKEEQMKQEAASKKKSKKK